MNKINKKVVGHFGVFLNKHKVTNTWGDYSCLFIFEVSLVSGGSGRCRLRQKCPKSVRLIDRLIDRPSFACDISFLECRECGGPVERRCLWHTVPTGWFPASLWLLSETILNKLTRSPCSLCKGHAVNYVRLLIGMCGRLHCWPVVNPTDFCLNFVGQSHMRQSMGLTNYRSD